MRKLTLAACLVLILVGSSGCFGPMKLMRGLDDWANQQYVDSSWLGAVMFYPVLIPGYVLAFVGDVFIVNVIDFWGESAWKDNGTMYIHRQPVEPEPR
ncbi:MAG: DUF3332 family protein [Planctomycetota bacterium]|jgi:hypothetical protein